MTSQLPLPADGLYTITKARPQLLASLQNTVPGTDVVLLPPSVGIGVGQRVGSISYSFSRIRSYYILFPPPVGCQENTKRKLYHNKSGKLSVVRWATCAWEACSWLPSASRVEALEYCCAQYLPVSDRGLSRAC